MFVTENINPHPRAQSSSFVVLAVLQSWWTLYFFLSSKWLHHLETMKLPLIILLNTSLINMEHIIGLTILVDYHSVPHNLYWTLFLLVQTFLIHFYIFPVDLMQLDQESFFHILSYVFSVSTNTAVLSPWVVLLHVVDTELDPSCFFFPKTTMRIFDLTISF